jgi:hypothetical protein
LNAFFDENEATRDRLEPFILPKFAEFESWRTKRVLEIGVDSGTDFVRFDLARARLSGMDPTETSIVLDGRRLALDGLKADFGTR